MTIFFTIIPKLAILLSGGSLLRAVYLCLCLWVVLVLTEVCRLRVGITLPFSYNGVTFSFYSQSKADIAVLREVFLQQEYLWNEVENPKSIIDLGAHVGDTALFYHTLYPQAHIYAVEPDPHSFALLCRNTKNISQITPIHAAVAGKSGTVTLHTSKQSSLRGSLTERSGATTKVEVPALSLADLFTQYTLTKVDLIKFDIEGGEQEMLGVGTPETYADAYIGEFHGDLTTLSAEAFSSKFKSFNVRMEPMGRVGRFKFRAQSK